MGGLFQLFWGRGGDFQELGHQAIFGLLMVLGTVMSFCLLIEKQSWLVYPLGPI